LELNTFCYHLENVLLHCLNAVLVFLLLWLIFGDAAAALLAEYGELGLSSVCSVNFPCGPSAP
jgi:hypothetical protein